MENKQSYSSNEVFAKGKCIADFFVKNTMDSIIHFLVLMMRGCGCTRTAGTAALSMDGGAGFECEQMEVGV